MHRVGVKAHKQQKVVDKPADPLLLAQQAVDGLNILGAFRDLHLRRALEKLQPRADYRERRLEFMPGVDEEVAAHLFEPRLFREVLKGDKPSARKLQGRRLYLHRHRAAVHYRQRPARVRFVKHEV
ncbi:hypothetical protein SDC9_203610 [bioreactor metagenome]|uniref:Uncharacterized protein n=1 Tax=bioreactor metagenome TaxID=1076179 RepID=A0A645IXN4_9ZZZZ